jgi:HlyD family secretion protein
VVLGVLALGLAGAWWVRPVVEGRAPRLAEGNVTVGVPGGVLGLGKLMPRGRVLTIATPFGAGDARIAEVLVREGEVVAAGAVLAVLDSAPTLRAALAVTQTTVAAREAALAQTVLMVTAGRDDARAALGRAEAAVRNTKRDFDRAAALMGRGDISEQVVDQRRLAWEQAAQDVARARAALARYDGAEVAAQADVVLARSNIEAARAERERARAELDKALIRAPSRGTVLTLYARPGERPGAQGLMTFGDLADMMAEIEVYENEAGAIRAGAPVTLVAEALGAPLAGRVGRIGVEVLRQTLTDASPAANTDTRVVRVGVDLDPAAAAIAARFVNLQVTARFERGAK